MRRQKGDCHFIYFSGPRYHGGITWLYEELNSLVFYYTVECIQQQRVQISEELNFLLLYTLHSLILHMTKLYPRDHIRLGLYSKTYTVMANSLCKSRVWSKGSNNILFLWRIFAMRQLVPDRKKREWSKGSNSLLLSYYHT